MTHKKQYQVLNGKIVFVRDIFRVQKLMYMTFTSFNGHMYSSVHELQLLKILTSDVNLLLHLESYKLIDTFLVIIELSAMQMKVKRKSTNINMW